MNKLVNGFAALAKMPRQKAPISVIINTTSYVAALLIFAKFLLPRIQPDFYAQYLEGILGRPGLAMKRNYPDLDYSFLKKGKGESMQISNTDKRSFCPEWPSNCMIRENGWKWVEEGSGHDKSELMNIRPTEVEKSGRGFSSCQGCDATIYLFKGKWYDIERPGGFVTPGRPTSFDPILHKIKGAKMISSNVVVWGNQYHCAWDSLKGPRRPVTCSASGWKDLKQ